MSPFRSSSQATRTRAALTIMLEETLAEIQRLKAEIPHEPDVRRKRVLKTRLRAAQAHYQGWADYVGKECPRVKNATEKPRPRRSK